MRTASLFVRLMLLCVHPNTNLTEILDWAGMPTLFTTVYDKTQQNQ
jgi:hypothetical protein